MKHVILGAGPAGVIAAETIRKHSASWALCTPEAWASCKTIFVRTCGSIWVLSAAMLKRSKAVTLSPNK